MNVFFTLLIQNRRNLFIGKIVPGHKFEGRISLLYCYQNKANTWMKETKTNKLKYHACIIIHQIHHQHVENGNDFNVEFKFMSSVYAFKSKRSLNIYVSCWWMKLRGVIEIILSIDFLTITASSGPFFSSICYWK